VSRTVLVAGASSGIGLATARAFVQLGDTVHAAARRDIDEPGVTAHRLDVTDRAAVDALAEQFSSLDALIVAAGANIPERRLHQLTGESWDHLIGANLTGPFNLLRAFLLEMG
jgi:NAD(P)-dependent dehydrogenase (short-subunit alcohol dehydrogenase family)